MDNKGKLDLGGASDDEVDRMLAVLTDPSAKQALRSLTMLILGAHNGRRRDKPQSFSGEWLEVIAKTCPQLEQISLTGCDKVTDAGLVQLLGGCQSLHQLLS